ncbi:MAG TPA: choice-of-anchor D domain-containing protein [Casimicrobiaceae bacterium]|jgi:hypothetical protein
MLVRVLALFCFAAIVAAPNARAQTGLQLYNTYCSGCHGAAINNKDGVLGGKDWTVIKLAMDTRPDMTAELRPLYNAGIIDDADFMTIATYLQTIPGGATASLVMPAPINFGSQAVGVGSAVQARNIGITGNAAVQISSPPSSSNPLEFPVVSTTCSAGSFVLPPTGTCSVSIQFTPAATGARSATISISSNGLGSPNSFTVSGTGGTGGPPPTGTLTMPGPHNFGSQAVGVQTAGANLTISNGSGTAVAISSITSSSPTEFPITGNSCATVNAGASCTVTVAFKPAANGARNGSLSITSNGTGSPQSITLSGTGTTTPPPPSGLSVPSSLGFGSQTVGVQSGGSPINVTNPGASTISISSIVSSSVSEFPIVGNTCGVVAGGASCTITMAFKPSSAGARSGSLTISSNGLGSPNVVALSGSGTVTGPSANKVPAVEYFNAGFGHYFMTAQSDEITGLDAGAFNFAFVRTGVGFNAWDAQAAGTVPVCRFFTTPGTFGTKSSHFYTANQAECDGLKLNPNWIYEKIAFFIAIPTGGVCPGGTIPVYRMYNHGQTGAPNHRFTTSFATYQQYTTTLGWDQEGIGFCAPL